jgi:hypothetical protein
MTDVHSLFGGRTLSRGEEGEIKQKETKLLFEDPPVHSAVSAKQQVSVRHGWAESRGSIKPISFGSVTLKYFKGGGGIVVTPSIFNVSSA